MSKQRVPILLTTDELAERWKMNPQTLINRRSQGKGPPFVHIGRRGKGKRPGVRYDLADVEAFERREAIG